MLDRFFNFFIIYTYMLKILGCKINKLNQRNMRLMVKNKNSFEIKKMDISSIVIEP